MIQDTAIVTIECELETDGTRGLEWCHYPWP